MTRTACITVLTVSAVLCGVLLSEIAVVAQGAGSSVLVLEDFSKAEPDGFPQGWEASRSESATRKAYIINKEDHQSFLRAKGIDDRMRIKKRIAWNPKEYPIAIWRWRLRSAPQSGGLIAAVFITLDTDLLFIPVFTKYIWSPSGTVGALKEGGMFSGSEIIVRSGTQRIGEWIEERINAYLDFVKIHKHEPAPQAWGISLVAGPGVEIDFGAIAVARQ